MKLLNEINSTRAAYIACSIPVAILFTSIVLTECGVGVAVVVLIHLALCLLVELILAKAKNQDPEDANRVGMIFFFSTIIVAITMSVAVGYSFLRHDIDARAVMLTLISSSWVLGAFLRMYRRLRY